jgi:hypothetical protein
MNPYQPDGHISAADVKDVAVDYIARLPIPGIEGSPLDPEDIWEVVVRASVGSQSVWEVTSQTDDTPCDDTVMEWLHTLLRPFLEVAANLLLAEQATTILDPERSRIVTADFVDNPYHGVCDVEGGELCSTSPTDGTTTCHRYCTAYVLTSGKPLTLAVTYVRSDEPEADAVERVLDRVEMYPFEIDAVLADRGFWQERVVRRAREIGAVAIPVVPKRGCLSKKLDTHQSYWSEYTMYEGRERELTFPLAVCVSYHSGDCGKSGEVVRGYVACDLTDRTPKRVEALYRKRSAIESSYRLFRQARARTTTRDPTIRFAYVLVGFLLENLWLVLRWAVVARPRRGGRDLRETFTFSVFCDWIAHRLDQELERRWELPTNGVGIPQTYLPAAG